MRKAIHAVRAASLTSHVRYTGSGTCAVHQERYICSTPGAVHVRYTKDHSTERYSSTAPPFLLCVVRDMHLPMCDVAYTNKNGVCATPQLCIILCVLPRMVVGLLGAPAVINTLVLAGLLLVPNPRWRFAHVDLARVS